MNNPKNRKYRPINYEELIEKYRKNEFQPLKAPQPFPKRKALFTTLSPYQGEWGKDQKMHLLRRTLFGVKPGDLAATDGLNTDETVDLLLTKGAAPDAPVNNYNNTGEGIEDPEIPFGQSWVMAGYGDELEGSRTVSLKAWLIKNMIHQSTSLEEKMVLFWHNLLPIQTWDIFYAKLSYQYFSMLRRHAFGNFKELIRDLTLNPAMLLYLNGAFNNKEAPDENYARELQELFCIGKGPDANFTEEDVQAAAKILTGWVVDWNKFRDPGELPSGFYPPFHDETDKQFSAFYGNRLIIGRSGAAGKEELDELLDMIFDNNETALYLSRRIYQFFVYSEIDDATEQNVIQPMAQLIRDNNYEVMPALKALFSSEHFFDEANVGAYIKNPLEYVVGFWRTFDLQGVDESNLYLDYVQHANLIWYTGNLGMEVGDPPSVSGWPAYYQAPSFDKYWITTDTITSRANISDGMIYYGFWVNEDIQVPADLIHFLTTLSDPGEPTNMLKESSELLLGMTISDELITSLKNILLSGQETDGYWTNAWADLMAHPEDMEYRLVVENRLKPTFQHLLQLGEAHLI